MLDTEKTKEQLIAELEAARCRIAGIELDTPLSPHPNRKRCSSHFESLVRLYELERASIFELLDFSLEEAIVLTNSLVGYIYFYDETTKMLTRYSWSKNVMEECSIVGKQTAYPLDSTGIWGEAVRQRKAIVVNDFSEANPLKKGYPDGHVVLKNFLTLPVFQSERIVAVVGVGNKYGDYADDDIERLGLFIKGVWNIVLRKQVEENLKKREEQLEIIASSCCDWEYWSDCDGKYVWVSPSSRNICGYSSENIGSNSKENIRKMIHPNDLEVWENHIHDVIDQPKECRGIDFRIMKPTGEVVWISHSCKPIYNVNDEYLGQRVTNRDITDRKQMEEALRLSEERYRSVVECQTEVISRFTPDGTIVFANEVYCRFFGKIVDEIIGFKWIPVAVAEDVPRIEMLLKSISPESPVVTIENRVYNAHNEIRWMHFINSAIFSNDSKIIEIQSVGRDITERKEAEEALRQSQLRWKFALEGSGDGVWDLDIINSTLYFSSRCKVMLGHKDHEIGNDPNEWKSRVHPDELEGCLKHLYRHFRGEISVYEKEHRLRCKNGSYKWVLSRGKVIQRDGEGGALRVIGTITDITERKRIEALKEQVDKIMRHDLRSPLLGIVGLPKLLLEKNDLKTREREILLMIRELGDKMLSMVDNSLAVYKMELGNYVLNPVSIDVVSLVVKTKSYLSTQFKYKNVGFVICLDQREIMHEDIFLVEGEELLCCNMLSNLLLNATEASPHDENVIVNLSTPSLSIKIVNKGCVPKEIRERFFDKYVTAGKKNGTGLGTYSAALIAKTHGWNIRLDTSVPGETAITVEF